MGVVRAGHLLAGGKRLEYRWHGPQPLTVPALVLLHEGLGCAAAWRDFPDALADATGLSTLAYSRAGYGGSQPAPPPWSSRYMHHEGLVVLPEVLDAAGVGEAVLVGHSDGGSIAVVYAGGVTGARARGLVLLAPHVFTEPAGLDSIRAAGRAYREGDLRARLARYHGDNVDGAFWGWHDAWTDPEFENWNLEEYLPAIDVPVLLLQGEDDPYGTERQVRAIEAGVAGPVETHLLAGCGHAPHREERARCLDLIRRFVAARWPAPRRGDTREVTDAHPEPPE